MQAYTESENLSEGHLNLELTFGRNFGTYHLLGHYTI